MVTKEDFIGTDLYKHFTEDFRQCRFMMSRDTGEIEMVSDARRWATPAD
jgi:hypothetical protein